MAVEGKSEELHGVYSHVQGSPSATENNFGNLLLLLHVNYLSSSLSILDYYTSAWLSASIVKTMVMWCLGNSSLLLFLRRNIYSNCWMLPGDICVFTDGLYANMCMVIYTGAHTMCVWIYTHTKCVYICVRFILTHKQKACITAWIY